LRWLGGGVDCHNAIRRPEMAGQVDHHGRALALFAAQDQGTSRALPAALSR